MKLFRSKSLFKSDLTVILCIVIFLAGSSLSVLAEEEDLKDKNITRAIEAEFWIDDVIDANTIDIKTHNGIVTLTGTATNILVKERSVKIAERIIGSHSWHPVPVLLWSKSCLPDNVEHFGERACMSGGLGPQFLGVDLMPLALGNALRLKRFGA